jgi:hypothetical protein
MGTIGPFGPEIIRLSRMDDFVRAWLAFGPTTHTYVSMTGRETRSRRWIPACAGMTEKQTSLMSQVTSAVSL